MPNPTKVPVPPLALLAAAVAALALTFGLCRAKAHKKNGRYHVAYAKASGDLLTHTESTPESKLALLRLERALWEDFSAIS